MAEDGEGEAPVEVPNPALQESSQGAHRSHRGSVPPRLTTMASVVKEILLVSAAVVITVVHSLRLYQPLGTTSCA